ncbi:NAD(P)-binding domain-containing protein [Listeria rocourtiae]|uniref:NAD(P)-binding domain-containing protein n=1 Tax=Listeria rocourtiae TaxID=647910 RepID=UPI0003E858EB|nr:NAD(P)-binding domain-containing protein [Listeria rocourtiae]EUJ44165.1 UDP-N-acetyl-D-mannosaminuronate dehydrogenase [Listeria rocourtiae FSL F6-920]
MKNKLLNKEARVAVIGLGYVGLPLAVAFIQKGFQTIGYDTSAKKSAVAGKWSVRHC